MPLKRKYTLVCILPVFFKINLSQSFDFCGKPDIIYNIPNLAEGFPPAWISSRHRSTEVLWGHWIDMLPDTTALLHTSRSIIPIPGIMDEKHRKILLSSGAKTPKALRAATSDAPDIFYMGAGCSFSHSLLQHRFHSRGSVKMVLPLSYLLGVRQQRGEIQEVL